MAVKGLENTGFGEVVEDCCVLIALVWGIQSFSLWCRKTLG